MNKHIVQFMRREYRSRFLKQNADGTWSLADGQTVRDKVSHAVRNMINKRNKLRLQRVRKRDEDRNHRQDAENIKLTETVSRVYQRQQTILDRMMKDEYYSDCGYIDDQKACAVTDMKDFDTQSDSCSGDGDLGGFLQGIFRQVSDGRCSPGTVFGLDVYEGLM